MSIQKSPPPYQGEGLGERGVPSPEGSLLLPPERIERVAGYGLTSQADGYLYRPTEVGEIRELLDLASRIGRKVVLRGAGRSYGDANIGAEAIVLDISRMRRILSWDKATGVIDCEAGSTIEDLWRTCLEDAYWPPVVSGTMFPTLAGALAMNIHGKNNFCAGTLGEHVLEIDVVFPLCPRERGEGPETPSPLMGEGGGEGEPRTNSPPESPLTLPSPTRGEGPESATPFTGQGRGESEPQTNRPSESPLTLRSPTRGEGPETPSPLMGEGWGEGEPQTNRPSESPLTLPSPTRGEGPETPSPLMGEGRGEGEPQTKSPPESPLTLPSPTRGEGPEVVTLTPEHPLFYAVISSAGLLGVITRVKLKMKEIYSGDLHVLPVACKNWDEQFAVLESFEQDSDYMVSWVDCFGRGKESGRGQIHIAWYAHESGGFSSTFRPEHQDLPDTILGFWPKSTVWRVLRRLNNRLGMRLINWAKYTASRKLGDRKMHDQSLVGFSFLLDYVPNWRKAYLPGGFIQYQSFVPKEHAKEVFARQVALQQEYCLESFLGVLKRHRPDKFLLSHAVDGYSLALDFKVTKRNWPRLQRLCHEMNDLVLQAGGRFYFAKDSTLRPSDAAAYLGPRLHKLRELKRELDPEGILTSSLAERLRLFDA